MKTLFIIVIMTEKVNKSLGNFQNNDEFLCIFLKILLAELMQGGFAEPV